MARPAGTYAIFETSLGNVVCRLFDKEAPKTVENFIGLAEGTKEFRDPISGKKEKRPYYDGLTFHRVIPQFMIQGGDPLGVAAAAPAIGLPMSSIPSYATTKPACCPWPTPAPTPTAANFSSPSPPRHTSTIATPSSAKSSRAWTSPTKYRKHRATRWISPAFLSL